MAQGSSMSGRGSPPIKEIQGAPRASETWGCQWQMHKWGRCGSRRPGKAPSRLTYLHNKRSELEALVQGNQSQPPLASAPLCQSTGPGPARPHGAGFSPSPPDADGLQAPLGEGGGAPTGRPKVLCTLCRPQRPWNEARGEGGGPSPSLPALPPPPGSGRLSRSLRNVARPGVQGLASRLQLFSCSQGGRVGRVGTWEAEPAWGLVSRRIHIY